MGKYMKKSKITSDVTVVMESTSLGVRTRAKTLALAAADSSSYIQLRNRHIEKPPLLLNEKNNKLILQQQQQQQQQQQKKQETLKKHVKETQDSCFNKKLNSKGSSRLTTSSFNETRDCQEEEEEVEGCFGKNEDFGVEVSFGENYWDFDSRDRSTRESTPCNLIKDSDTIGTPGSTTRRAGSSATDRRVRNNIQRNIPTTHEMEEFFACAEQRQQRLFIEKYNFDVENDLPLPGRYEWVQVIP